MTPDTKTPPSAKTEAGGPAEATLPAAQAETLLRNPTAENYSYVRLAADFENFKRRSRLDLEAHAAAQKNAFITELLPVIDNLERAIGSGVSGNSVQFHQGVEITLKQLQQLLRQNGIESGDMTGLPFDPHRHEALSQGHDPSQPDRAILKVLRRGYSRGGKVLRAANVVVNDLTPPCPAHGGA